MSLLPTAVALVLPPIHGGCVVGIGFFALHCAWCCAVGIGFGSHCTAHECVPTHPLLPHGWRIQCMTAAACVKLMPVSVFPGPFVPLLAYTAHRPAPRCKALVTHCSWPGSCTCTMGQEMHRHGRPADKKKAAAHALRSQVLIWVSVSWHCNSANQWTLVQREWLLHSWAVVWCPESCAKRVSQRARCRKDTHVLLQHRVCRRPHTFCSVLCAVCVQCSLTCLGE